MGTVSARWGHDMQTGLSKDLRDKAQVYESFRREDEVPSNSRVGRVGFVI